MTRPSEPLRQVARELREHAEHNSDVWRADQIEEFADRYDAAIAALQEVDHYELPAKATQMIAAVLAKAGVKP
jgi:hypothetical protein